MKIGFIGLGHMGFHMASNLLKSKFDLTVFNRTLSKSEELQSQGAKIAPSIKDLVSQVDCVLTCLADIPITQEIWLGTDGIIENVKADQILVDHATVDLTTSNRCSKAAEEKSASFLDAPISGGPGGAEEATLSIMAGGEESTFQKALPVFEAMGKTILHMGPTGSGTTTKLANQLLVGVHTLATCEAYTLARKAGVDLEKLTYILERSWGQSRMVERNAPNIISRNFGPSSAPLRNLLKDLKIINELGNHQGLELPEAQIAEAFFRKLSEAGKAEWDIACACLLLEGED